MRRWLWIVAGLPILAGLLYGYWPQGESVPRGSLSEQRLEAHLCRVAVEDFLVEDMARPTDANGDYPGRASRLLQGKLWQPDESCGGGAAAPFPLLVYAHGFMSFHQEGAYLAEFLASQGYVVIAVDFPLSNYFAPGGPRVSDVIHQPGDVRFVMDRALARNQTPGDSLYRRIDAERIGVLGLSLGGMTTEMVTFDRRYRDPRIQAAVSIAGPSRMFNERFFSSTRIPFMMIAGEGDAIVSYAHNARPLRVKSPDSVLVSLRKGSHAGFAGIAALLFRWSRNPDYYGCARMQDKVQHNDSDFAKLLDEDAGVISSERTGFCDNYQHLPVAMRPAQQQDLTTLAVHAFFESVFAKTAETRQASANFLLKDLAAENPEVRVEAGDYRHPSPPPSAP